MATRIRLSAAERRQAVLETACRAFSHGSYRGTTTADIAREAGVSEPILYRHFSCKRDLFLACLDETWQHLRTTWERAIAKEEDPSRWLPQMGEAFVELQRAKHQLSNLWVQALNEAADDPEVRRYLRKHLQRVHDFIAEVIVQCQERGVVAAERDPNAEAWIFVSLGLLGSIGRRLGGLVADDLPAIIASRREWLTGGKPS